MVILKHLYPVKHLQVYILYIILVYILYILVLQLIVQVTLITILLCTFRPLKYRIAAHARAQQVTVYACSKHLLVYRFN